MIINDGKLTITNLFGHIITSGHNQNIIILIEAKPGKGKSYAAMDLAVWLSYKMQKKFGGKPWDYFNIGHMAIIMPDEIIRIAENVKQYGIYIFDDFGVGYSARDWHSDANKAMNNVLETMRTKNNVLIMTVPDSDWIDKIGRNILHFKIVMHQAMFDLGLTTGKLTMEEKQYNTVSRKVLHPYLKNSTEIYNYIVFGKPPKSLCDEYDIRRKIQLQRLDSQAMQVLKDKEIAKKEAIEKANQPTKAEIALEIKRDFEMGIYPTIKEGCKQRGIKYSTARNAIHKAACM